MNSTKLVRGFEALDLLSVQCQRGPVVLSAENTIADPIGRTCRNLAAAPLSHESKMFEINMAAARNSRSGMRN
jgi:hypothetical protein